MVRNSGSRRAQSGLTILGALFVVALIAIGGYFGYQWYMAREDAPTCKSDHLSCMRMCRRLTTDAAEAQKCQSNCDGELAACERGTGQR